jgi:hypothetical protein
MSSVASVQENEPRDASGQGGFNHSGSLHSFLKPIESALPPAGKRFAIPRAENPRLPTNFLCHSIVSPVMGFGRNIPLRGMLALKGESVLITS